MSALFNTFIYIPLYNLLIFFLSVLPWHSAALALVVLTLLVKFALLPLAYKMAHTQKKMKEISPKIKEIQKKHKDDKQKQTMEIMALYKEHKVKPLSSFLNLLIQLPIIIGLYWVLLKSGLPEIKTELLYNFVKIPDSVNMHLFNISMSDKSVFFAVLAGLSQFYYAHLTHKDMTFTEEDDKDSFKADFQKSLQLQMKFVLPVFIAFIAYSLGAGLALYFLVSNLFMVGQEYYFRFKKVK